MTQATTVPLMMPVGVAVAADGTLYFSESGSNVVRAISPVGILTSVAGSGIQGFTGDGGPALEAALDEPMGLAIDTTGSLLIADTRNHRVRRVDFGTGTISTLAGNGLFGAPEENVPALATALGLPSALVVDVSGALLLADAASHRIYRIDQKTKTIAAVAGSGVQGFSGDGGPALQAALDSPGGLAVDSSGNIYLADTHNQRVRRVDALSHVITSVAGTGRLGFTGDAGTAGTAALALPRGLSLDSAGNLYLADSGNHRIRRIDRITGRIDSVAGDGVQTFAGDGGPAAKASLDSPHTVTLSAGALPALADTGNQRIRQVDANGDIHTVGGLGAGTSAVLVLSAPAVALYGTGTLTATLRTSPATGQVTFFDAGRTLLSTALQANRATLDLGSLAAGEHRLAATYTGDPAHGGAISETLSVTLAPADVHAVPVPVSLLYGQAIPVLNGTLTGVLPRDTAAVRLLLSSAARMFSPPGSYVIAGALDGSAAANYTLTTEAAAVSIAQAPSSVALSQTLAVHVGTITAGTPGGQVDLLDGANVAATAVLSSAGDASFQASSLPAGSHTLTAAYRGDRNFLEARSAPVVVTTSPADFTLASAGQAALSIPAGTSGAFNFMVTPVNAVLVSQIALSASGLPPGAVASFSPTYVMPSASATGVTLTIQTLKAANEPGALPYGLAMLLPAIGWVRRRGAWRALAAVACIATLGLVTGCGDRVTRIASTSAGRSYTITVKGTATSTLGTPIEHATTVTLTLL